MKIIRSTTLILAALMLGGCGRIDEAETPSSGSAAGSSLSAVTPVSDSSESSAESESSEAESADKAETTETPDKDGASGYFGTYINDNNCIITTGTDEGSYKEFVADKQLLYYSAERIIDQYNCIADRDKQGFFDSIGYSDLYKSEYAPTFWAEGFLKEDFEYFLSEEEIYEETIHYTHYLLGEDLWAVQEKYPDDGDIHETDYDREEVLAEFRGLMDKAAEKATFENSEAYIDERSCFNRLLRKEGSITDEEFFSSPEKFRLEPSDDKIYIIDMYYGYVSCDSADIKVKMKVTVLNGDYAYDFYDCLLWLTKDGCHVIPFPVSVYENPCKGKTIDEIAAERKEEIRKREDDEYDVPSPAEAAMDGAYYQFNEGMYEGEGNTLTWQKLLDYGSYALSVSEEGLPVTSGWSDDEYGIGDQEILFTMNDNGYESGTVWIRPEPDGSGDIYTIYESPDGQKEEYHITQMPWF